MKHQKTQQVKRKIKQLDSYLAQNTLKRVRNSVSYSILPYSDLYQYKMVVSPKNNRSPSQLSNQQQEQINNFREQNNVKQSLKNIQSKLNNLRIMFNMELPANIDLTKKCNKFKKNKDKNKFLITSLSPRASERITQAIQHRKGYLENQNLETFTSTIFKPKNIVKNNENPYKKQQNNKYYRAQLVRAMHQPNSLAVQHVRQSILFLKLLRHINPQPQTQPIFLSYKNQHRKTLILDLDETLIHCLQEVDVNPDLKLKVVIQNTKMQIGISIRPYALSFLKRMSKKWQVIIFTASHQSYADAILDQIDPDKQIISHRLYRQHCRQVEGILIKDISRLNRKLQETVIVDNAAYSYCLQLDNAIPILPFYDGKDYELGALQQYLDVLIRQKDVRVINRQYFKLKRYVEFSQSQILIEQLYTNKKNNQY